MEVAVRATKGEKNARIIKFNKIKERDMQRIPHQMRLGSPNVTSVIEMAKTPIIVEWSCAIYRLTHLLQQKTPRID